MFVGGDGRGIRGRDAIVAEWAGLIDRKQLVLRWYPDVVDMSGDDRRALSRGPYWMDDTRAPADGRYLAGRFVSTWLRGDDGRWPVVFDGAGGSVPKPATRSGIEALAAARKGCPYR